MWSRWRWSGINETELLYSLIRTMRRPEWLLLIVALLCLLLWLAVSAVNSWIAGLTGP
jgi:hypothetical protein